MKIQHINLRKWHWGTSQVVPVVKNLPTKAGDTGDTDLIPGSGRFPQRRKWQPTPVLLPGKCYGQRSLAGYSPWNHRETQLNLTTKPKFKKK